MYNSFSFRALAVVGALSLSALALQACGQSKSSSSTPPELKRNTAAMPTAAQTAGLATATFAGGCFWSFEEVFEEVKGVKYAVAGYAGGTKVNPAYEDVTTGSTGHAESVQVYYDPKVVSFSKLVDVFLLGAHDPTQKNRQGNDVGTQYRSVAFYSTPAEKATIEAAIKRINASKHYAAPIASQVTPMTKFYPAEAYHQGYYRLHFYDNSYVSGYSASKVAKFRKAFPDLLKSPL